MPVHIACSCHYSSLPAFHRVHNHRLQVGAPSEARDSPHEGFKLYVVVLCYIKCSHHELRRSARAGNPVSISHPRLPPPHAHTPSPKLSLCQTAPHIAPALKLSITRRQGHAPCKWPSRLVVRATKRLFTHDHFCLRNLIRQGFLCYLTPQKLRPIQEQDLPAGHNFKRPPNDTTSRARP